MLVQCTIPIISTDNTCGRHIGWWWDVAHRQLTTRWQPSQSMLVLVALGGSLIKKFYCRYVWLTRPDKLQLEDDHILSSGNFSHVLANLMNYSCLVSTIKYYAIKNSAILASHIFSMSMIKFSFESVIVIHWQSRIKVNWIMNLGLWFRLG